MEVNSRHHVLFQWAVVSRAYVAMRHRSANVAGHEHSLARRKRFTVARCVSSDEHQVMSTATGLLAQLCASVYLHWHDIAQQARRCRHIVLV